jgi:hypothetical protein
MSSSKILSWDFAAGVYFSVAQRPYPLPNTRRGGVGGRIEPERRALGRKYKHY